MTEEISDVENEDRYNLLMDYMRNRKPLKFIEWWEVENTGWSGGVSWFRTGGTNGDPRRFETEKEAKDYALRRKAELNSPDTKWRYVHTTLEREDNKSVTTEVWTEV